MLLKNDRIGESRRMKCGLMATIVRYNRSDDIVIRFEKGFGEKRAQFKYFVTGEILPNIYFTIKPYKDKYGRGIKITNLVGRSWIMDKEDIYILKSYRWNVILNGGEHYGRETVTRYDSVSRREIFLYNCVLGLRYLKKGWHVLFKNKRWLDFRKKNLEYAPFTNDHFIKCRNKNGYRGVTRVRSYYWAEVMVNWKRIRSGPYKTAKEAGGEYLKLCYAKR
jgi:hypothetical protein